MNVETYIKENIDEDTVIKPWPEKNKLPVFLKNIYSFYRLEILGMSCILLEIKNEAPGIDVIKKHISRIAGIANEPIVLLYSEISWHRRKSLIENRIPFIIEDGQMFLPFLGLVLKRTPQFVDEKQETFSVSAQTAFLFFLYNKDVVVNTTQFARMMGFTVMKASRALNELYDAKLITYKLGGKTGRSKEYRRIDDPEYFQKGLAYVKTPVKNVVYAQKSPEGALVAGYDALAELTMINGTQIPVRAICRKQLSEENMGVVSSKEMAKDLKLVKIQVWEYDPKLFAENDHVDRMSLYASLREEKDERTEQALEDLLRGETWYTV